MPGLAGDDAAIANRLLVYECASSLLRFKADVFIAGDALAFDEAGGREHLDAMTYREDPFLLHIELADDIEQAPVVAEVLRSTAAQNEDGIVVIHFDLVEREVGGQTITRTLDIGVPTWFKVVHHEMEPSNRRSSNGCAPVFLAKPMNRVKRFVGFASISGNDQYPRHFLGQCIRGHRFAITPNAPRYTDAAVFRLSGEGTGTSGK